MSLTKPRHQATQEAYEATRLSNLNFRLKFTVTFLFRHSVQESGSDLSSPLYPLSQCLTLISNSAVKRSIGSTTGCTIREKAPTRAFSWVKAAITAFTFKTLC